MIGFEDKLKFWKYLLLFFLGIGLGFSSVKVWELTRGNQENGQLIYASKAEVAGLKIRESINHNLPKNNPQSYVYLPLIFMPDSIQNGGFEAGSDSSWSEYSLKGSSLITNDTSPNFLYARTGDWLAWLGGRVNETSRLSQRINISGGGVTLYYWYYIGSVDTCGNDHFCIKIDGVVKQSYDLCEDHYSIDWELGMLDLSAYHGKSMDLMFEVTTNGTNNSNLALDDISFIDPR